MKLSLDITRQDLIDAATKALSRTAVGVYINEAGYCWVGIQTEANAHDYSAIDVDTMDELRADGVEGVTRFIEEQWDIILDAAETALAD